MPNRGLLGVGVVLAGGVLAAVFVCDGDPPPTTEKGKPPGTGRTRPAGKGGVPPGPPQPDGYLTAELCKEGWPRETAAAVEKLTEEAWEPPTREWAERHPTVVPLLARLGRIPAAMEVLARRPECALLLADSHHPDRLARVLGGLDDRAYPVVEGWLKQAVTPDDADLLLEALERQAGLLVELWGQHLIGAENLFTFPRRTKADEEYEKWLADLLRLDLPRGDHAGDARAALFVFLLRQGPEIRRRLAADPAFEKAFRTDLWPRFARLAAPDLWDVYAAMPGLWDVLRLDDGEALVRKYFQLPVLLLHSAEAYPAEFRDLILQALRQDDLALLLALELCRREPEFRHLLGRRGQLTAAAFRGVVERLAAVPVPPEGATDEAAEKAEMAAAAERVRILRQVAEWSAAVVEKEYGGRTDPFLVCMLPGYDVYALADKLVDGRPVDTGDVVAAGIDVGGFLIPGSQAAKATGKTAGAKAGKVIARGASQAGEEAAKRTAARYSRRVAGGVDSSAARSLQLGNAVRAAQAPLAELHKHPHGVELTLVLRELKDQSRTGRSSLEKLVAWEAKFIVRVDGRVFASRTITGSDVARNLAEYLAVERVQKWCDARNRPEDAEQAWRRNVYAWWAAQMSRRP